MKEQWSLLIILLLSHAPCSHEDDIDDEDDVDVGVDEVDDDDDVDDDISDSWVMQAWKSDDHPPSFFFLTLLAAVSAEDGADYDDED